MEKAAADFARARTGFAIGGIPPLGHTEPMVTLLDEDLRQYSVLWAAAGGPTAVFQLTPADLASVTGGRWVCVK